MRPRMFTVLAILIGMASVLTLLCLLAGPAMPAQADATMHYVAPGGDCGGATPCYTTIQAAVDAAANGDAIKVAQSVYTGTGFAVVIINKAITLTGGYTTTHWVNSYPITQPTVIDAENVNGRRGVYIDGSTVTTITLSGLTIQRGHAQGQGGGIYILSGAVVLQDSRVMSNSIMVPGSGRVGGGIYINNAIVTLKNNLIQGNSGVGNGGGIHVNDGSVTLTGNTVQSNTASGGGGGGISIFSGVITLTNNLILGNWLIYTANGGGGNLYLR